MLKDGKAGLLQHSPSGWSRWHFADVVTFSSVGGEDGPFLAVFSTKEGLRAAQQTIGFLFDGTVVIDNQEDFFRSVDAYDDELVILDPHFVDGGLVRYRLVYDTRKRRPFATLH